MIDAMLDTNVINRVLDANVDPNSLSRVARMFLTHVQINELQATRNEDRLTKLIAAVESIDHVRIATSVAVWGESEWGESEFGGGGDNRFELMLDALNIRNGSKANNARDILIGLTALARGYTLVTNDADLSAVVSEFGGAVISFEDLTGCVG